jgi:hypothetical protein
MFLGTAIGDFMGKNKGRFPLSKEVHCTFFEFSDANVLFINQLVDFTHSDFGVVLSKIIDFYKLSNPALFLSWTNEKHDELTKEINKKHSDMCAFFNLVKDHNIKLSNQKIKIIALLKRFNVVTEIHPKLCESFLNKVTSLPDPYFYDESTFFGFLKNIQGTNQEILIPFQKYLNENNGWS